MGISILPVHDTYGQIHRRFMQPKISKIIKGFMGREERYTLT